MNSFSYYAFGAVCERMMADLAVIDRAAPGFDRVKITPRSTATISHAAASTETWHGISAIKGSHLTLGSPTYPFAAAL